MCTPTLRVSQCHHHFNNNPQVLGKNHVIKSLEKCDFTPIYDHLMAERDKKKNMTKEVGRGRRGRREGCGCGCG